MILAQQSSVLSLDEFGIDEFRQSARSARDEFSSRKVVESDWEAFAKSLDYVPAFSGFACIT